jgi:hypothetical protein
MTVQKKRTAPKRDRASPAIRDGRTGSPRNSMPARAVNTGDMVGMIIPASDAGAIASPRSRTNNSPEMRRVV